MCQVFCASECRFREYLGLIFVKYWWYQCTCYTSYQLKWLLKYLIQFSYVIKVSCILRASRTTSLRTILTWIVPPFRSPGRFPWGQFATHNCQPSQSKLEEVVWRIMVWIWIARERKLSGEYLIGGVVSGEVFKGEVVLDSWCELSGESCPKVRSLF